MSVTPTIPPLDDDVWTPELQADWERLVSVGEECISETELKALLLRKGRLSETSSSGFVLYDGFEPSGRMHIAQGVFKAMNVNKCTSDNVNSTFVFWVADWFALMNDKMGGDLNKIITVGKYLIQVWKAAGMNLEHVQFKWASEEITQNAETYWPMMLDIARRFNVTRIKKCCQIMGRSENTLSSAQVLYPIMQCTDVFFLKADICQLGVDQRKVNMLAREYCDAAGRKIKPIILSHHMLYGLKAGQEKMSKSDPDSAIFMEDSSDTVERKIRNAYCPNVEDEPAVASGNEEEDAGKASMHLKVDTLKNPCLDYIQHIIFSAPGATFETEDGTIYKDYASVRAAFLSGKISEDQLKTGLIHALNQLLEPVRQHFSNDPEAKRLLELVQEYKKEAAPSSSESVIRRLNLVELGKVPSNAHLVFTPLPCASPSLQQAMDVLAQLRQHDDKPCVLFLSDWSARVCNSCNADIKAITAFYTVFLASLTALDAGMMSRVQIVWQSEAILCDPSNYWISVINVGRHFQLDKVMGPTMVDSEGVGMVIARLMKVADVISIEPNSISLLDHNDSVVEKELVEDFYQAKLNSLTVPIVHLTQTTSIRLQVERESEALATENDEYFLLDDPKVCFKCFRI
jgi:tyrosyl-tRNA synthetase